MCVCVVDIKKVKVKIKINKIMHVILHLYILSEILLSVFY